MSPAHQSGHRGRPDPGGRLDRVRIPAKVDYAIRALAELAVAGDGPVKAEQLAAAQDIPLNFLREIMGDLRARPHRPQPSRARGWLRARPAGRQITLADIFRAVDGPLAEVATRA